MIRVADYITDFPSMPVSETVPWDIIRNLGSIIRQMISRLTGDYDISGEIAIHKSAVIEKSAVIKAPAIIGAGCFVGNNALLRGGILLLHNVSIGPGCEIKSSIICGDSSVAHFNFIGDSLIGADVNLEAGSIIANHYNERIDKTIVITDGIEVINTGLDKFGALVGDHCRIGANAVLSPGTILKPGQVVGRLELIKQT